MDYSFLYNTDGTIHKYRITESYIKLQYPDLHKQILNTKFYENLTWSNRLWHFIYGEAVPLCNNCSKPVKFLSFTQGYRNYCSSKCVATNNDIKIKKQNTSVKKYGVDHHFKNKKIIDKRTKTYFLNYDPSKTAHEIMLDRKIYRIYDCGSLKYELIL